VTRPPGYFLGPVRLAGVSLLLAASFTAAGAAAEGAPSPDAVIVLEPRAASAGTQRSVARIRDELSADRLRVVVAKATATGVPEEAIESAAGDSGGGKILALFGDAETGQVELCLVQRAGRRLAIRRAMVVVDDPELMPAALATRALELLRATDLELSIEVQRVPPAAKSPDARPAGGPPMVVAPALAAVEPTRFAIETGIGVRNSIAGPPPALAAVARVGLRLSDWAWARVSGAGLGSHPRVEDAAGSATLSQSFALAELAAEFGGNKLIRPRVSVGAGALNVAVAGVGAAPYEGREPRRWSGALDGGAGVGLAIGSGVAVVTEGHVLLASPHPVVRFVDRRAAAVGFPSLILTLALQVAL
jgi:hypothetical protein